MCTEDTSHYITNDNNENDDDDNDDNNVWFLQL